MCLAVWTQMSTCFASVQRFCGQEVLCIVSNRWNGNRSSIPRIVAWNRWSSKVLFYNLACCTTWDVKTARGFLRQRPSKPSHQSISPEESIDPNFQETYLLSCLVKGLHLWVHFWMPTDQQWFWSKTDQNHWSHQRPCKNIQKPFQNHIKSQPKTKKKFQVNHSKKKKKKNTCTSTTARPSFPDAMMSYKDSACFTAKR